MPWLGGPSPSVMLGLTWVYRARVCSWRARVPIRPRAPTCNWPTSCCERTVPFRWAQPVCDRGRGVRLASAALREIQLFDRCCLLLMEHIGSGAAPAQGARGLARGECHCCAVCGSGRRRRCIRWRRQPHEQQRWRRARSAYQCRTLGPCEAATDPAASGVREVP